MPTGGKNVNVKVAVRCRPLSASEKARGCSEIVEFDGATTTVAPVGGGDASVPTDSARGSARGGQKTFTYDHSYGTDVDQVTVYNDLAAPLVGQSLEGFNGTVFAYGQTGSGKTHTMMGDSRDPGIIPLLKKDLFAAVSAAKDAEEADGTGSGAGASGDKTKTQFLVTVSYLEIYNEVIKDLLNPSDKHLKLRENPTTGVFVENLAELVVEDEAATAALVTQGNKVRRVAATQMNERSSRSHSVFTIRVEQRQEENVGKVTRTRTLSSKINLVDLAGSERADKTGATGDRLREGAAINKSLSALANVINALADGKGHTPYRDSKLTRLLQHSLGGNSLTVMVATISPADYNREETLSTLQYAARAKTIKNATHINETVTEKLIRELRQTIEELRAQLAAASTGGGGGGEEDSDAVAAMRERIEALESEQRNSWEERQRLSSQFEEERKKNMASEKKIRSVMQTMKEENMELLKRVRGLQAEKVELTRRYKKQKETYLSIRAQLEGDTAKYEELVRTKGKDTEELAPLLESVSAHKKDLIAVRDAMNETKKALKVNEERQTEERAAAAAQRMMLEEDAELRKAIQEDERAKMEAERSVFLEQALEEERERLKEQTAREREALIAKYSKSSSSASSSSAGDSAELSALRTKEQGMELALLQANADKDMMRLEMEEMRRRHEAEVKTLNREHRRLLRATKLEELKMFREFCEGFESERKQMESKYRETAECLRQAVKDIVFLTKRNAELERQMLEQASWEPRR